MRRTLSARLSRVHRIGSSENDAFMEGVLHKRLGIGATVKLGVVRLVLGEKHGSIAFPREVVLAECRMDCLHLLVASEMQ